MFCSCSYRNIIREYLIFVIIIFGKISVQEVLTFESMSCTDLACSLILVKPREVLMKFNADNWSKVSATIMAINKTKNSEIIDVQLPMTKYFYLDALPKKIVIGPGSNLEMTLNLAKLTEQRIYYDTFIVLCRNDCHHEIQLEAEPQHKILDEIPRVVDFGHVPLGYLATEMIILSPSERKIGFLFIAICSNPDFAVTPTRGVISDKPVKIKIFYKPTAFITFRASVQVFFPSLMSTPLCFTVSAYTAPGYERDKIFEAADKLNQPEPRYKYYRPVYLKKIESNEYIAGDDKELDFKWKWYRSRKVFFEKPDPDEKLKYELLGPLGRYLDTENQIKRLREIEFNDYITETRNENNATNIHNNPKLSSFEVFDKDVERLMEWDSYRNLLKPPINWATITEPEFIRQRTVDYYNSRQQPQFTDRVPSLWFIRYVKMIKFIDAARKIILRNRLLKALSILRQLTKEDIEILESGEYHEKVSEEKTEDNEE